MTRLLAAGNEAPLRHSVGHKAEARYRVGLESYINVVQKRYDLVSARAELAQAQESLEEAYRGLNQLLRLSLDARPVLAGEPEFVPLEVADVQAEITRIVEASPDVWQLNEKIKLQKNTYGRKQVAT
ncbi:TolC family protein [Moorellaceae bacterium AZ2]